MTDTASSTDSTTEPHGTEGGTESAETPTVEDLLAKVESLTAESRKWEDRAKANKGKADQLDEAERARMTDAERASADLTAAQTERDDAVRERDDARAELTRYKVATEFGLSEDDVETLSAVTDEDALRKLAERLSGQKPAGLTPHPSQGRRGSTAAPTAAEAFAEALIPLL